LKYFTYDQLKRFNQSSIKANRNRTLDWRSINKQIKVLGQERMAQKEDLLFPILSSMIHNDKEIRTEVAFGSERIYLDISFKQYANLDDDKNVGETTFIF